jgi:hypothetical protein
VPGDQLAVPAQQRRRGDEDDHEERSVRWPLPWASVSLGATPASAATDLDCALVTGHGTATSYRWIQVTNTCRGPITVKLDFNNANDSGCY